MHSQDLELGLIQGFLWQKLAVFELESRQIPTSLGIGIVGLLIQTASGKTGA